MFKNFAEAGGLHALTQALTACMSESEGRLQRRSAAFAGRTYMLNETICGVNSTGAAQATRPSYLVNRWLTAIFTAYEGRITDLIRERDRALAARLPPDGVGARQDCALEVTSAFNLPDR